LFKILIIISGRVIGKGGADVVIWEENSNNHNNAVRRYGNGCAEIRPHAMQR
jgi:hypothetical protein